MRLYTITPAVEEPEESERMPARNPASCRVLGDGETPTSDCPATALTIVVGEVGAAKPWSNALHRTAVFCANAATACRANAKNIIPECLILRSPLLMGESYCFCMRLSSIGGFTSYVRDGKP